MKNTTPCVILEVGKPFSPHGLFNFTQIPDCIGQYLGISPGAKLVYGRLFRYTMRGKSTVAWPKLDTLAAECGMSVRQVARYVNELVQDGFLTKTRTGATKSNTYQFIGHPAYSGDIGVMRARGINSDRTYTADHKVIGRIRQISDRTYTADQPLLYPYCVKREVFEERNTHTASDPAPTPTNTKTEHSPLPGESESEHPNYRNSSVTEDSTDYGDSTADPNDKGTLRNFNVVNPAVYADFALVVRQVRSKHIKDKSSAKQRQVMEDAWDRAIAKCPVGEDELRARYERFVEWADSKSGIVDPVLFLSKGIDSWELREYAAPAHRIDSAGPQAASASTGASKAPAAHPGSNLREIWNEYCPDSPADETIERVKGWQQWTGEAEFAEKFREIATLAAACRASGCQWVTLPWLMKKQDGNALWNWQRLLKGDFSPREKAARQVVKADDDALIREVMEDGVRQEKQLRDRLRREWIQKNLEREEDGLKPKPKPTKLVELEAKHGEN